MSKVEDKTLEELKKEMDATIDDADAAYEAATDVTWAAADAEENIWTTAIAATIAYQKKLKEIENET